MGAWELVLLPKGKKALPCRWVFKRKLTADGNIERYKARLVVKGFHQVYGRDYDNIFAPVVRASTVRILFSIVAILDLEMHSIDIKNAFIQGDLEEEVYMQQPPGCGDGSSKVCRLRKSLYGLKQAPRVWNKKLHTFLTSYGAKQCLSDGALYLLQLDEGLVLILVYVDDIVIASKPLQQVQSVKKAILAQFSGKDLGETDFFLQMAVQRDRKRHTLRLCQQRHIQQIVTTCGLESAKKKNIPMIGKVYDDPDGASLTEDGATQYRSIIGGIMHVSNYTRPDVSFAVNYLSRFMAVPAANHLARAKDLVAYLHATADDCLVLGGESLTIHGCCDADYAGCKMSRRSTSGYALFLGNGIVDWKSQRQATVSRSTAEAEYIAAAELSKAVTYMLGMSIQVGIPDQKVQVGIDNQSALALTKDPISASRTKHVDIAYHHVRDLVKYGMMGFNYIPSEQNAADIFTKPLAVELFQKHKHTLGVLKS